MALERREAKKPGDEQPVGRSGVAVLTPARAVSLQWRSRKKQKRIEKLQAKKVRKWAFYAEHGRYQSQLQFFTGTIMPAN